MVGRDPSEFLGAAQAGDARALGRLLSMVEHGGPEGQTVGRLAFAAAGEFRQVIGITGAPGSGKSTLVARLVAEARATQGRVGVLAIDPSSPFSGGAILGDRVRMQDHVGDHGVYIRSMASRGHLGGLALAVPEAVRVLVAAGLATVLVETVGVGQVEVEVAGAADTTVVVVNPGWGDAIQANKAGLLEVADLLVVNKADRSGVSETKRDLEQMLDLDTQMGEWRPPVLAAVASRGEGVAGVWEAIEAHRDHLASSGELDERRQRRLLDELAAILVRHWQASVESQAAGALWESVTSALLAGRLDPYSAATALLSAGER